MDIITPSSGVVTGSIPVAGAIKTRPAITVGLVFIVLVRIDVLRDLSRNQVRITDSPSSIKTL